MTDVHARKHDCDACPLGDAMERREFLRSAMAGVLAAGALSVSPTDIFAQPVAFITGLGGRIDKSYPIPATPGVSFDKDESVIIARVTDRVFAFSLACPHQNTALRWDATNARFQCPKHKSRYRPDGVFIEGRATRGLDRFALRLEGNLLQVNLDALYREDKNAVEWSTAFVDLVPHEK